MKQIHCQKAIIVFRGKITGFAKQVIIIFSDIKN